MEVDKQLSFKSHKSMTVEFFLTNVDVMTHSCMSSVALAFNSSYTYTELNLIGAYQDNIASYSNNRMTC